MNFLMLLYYELRYFTNLRNKMYQFLIFVQPLLFLTVFYFLQQIRGNTNLEHFVIVSSLISMWSYVLYSSGSSLISQKWSGTLEFIISSQTSLYQVILTKTISNSIVALLAMIMNFIYAKVFFQLPINIEHLGLFIIGIFLLLLSLCSIGMILAAVFAVFQNVFEYQDFILTPMVLLSGIFLSVSTYPLPLQIVSSMIPMTWGVKTIYAALNDTSAFMINAATCVGLSFIYFFIIYIVIQKLENILRTSGKWRQI